MRTLSLASHVAIFVCVFATSMPAQGTAESSPKPPSRGTPAMERVTGIGGFFFRAKDPKALTEWYEKHLGVTRTPDSYDKEPWGQDAGWTVFAPFAEDTKYFGADTQQWMINFRVRDLDAMVTQLRSAGIEVTVDPESYPNGRFARLADPEGNPIQLWQPQRPPETELEGKGEGKEPAVEMRMR